MPLSASAASTADTMGGAPEASPDRDVLHLRLAPALGLESLDHEVEDRAHEQEDLADQVRHLLLKLGRDELAQRAEKRDELCELLVGAAARFGPRRCRPSLR